MIIKSSLVIFQALKTSAASLTLVSSETLLASTASTALFSQQKSWSWLFDHPCHKMTNTGPLLGIGSSKIQFFTDIWYSFCQRLLRPAYVTFLKTGWWNANAQTSEIHRYLHSNKEVVFSWPQMFSNYIKTSRNTL
jgi:hypothetical protein